MSEEIIHYGVRGMKWGKRKAPLNASYTQKDRNQDVSDYGLRGRQRISNRMDKGKSLNSARRSEKIRKAVPRAAIAGVGLTLAAGGQFLLAMETPQGRQTIGRGVQFIGTHAKSKTSQAAVMKGARYLDKIYGLG